MSQTSMSLDHSPRGQKGVALVIALVLLVVATLLGLSSIRTVALEERMAGNTYDRSIAFQSAEAALRVGEGVAEAQSKLGTPNSGFPAYTDAGDDCGTTAINNCSQGLCSKPDPDCTARWQASTFTGWLNASGLTLDQLTASGAAPQFFVELLGNTYACNPQDSNACSGGPGSFGCNCARYRVTARSNPGTGRASVTVQSIYAPL